MKIALISDIHGNLPALEAVLQDIAARGVDHIVNLGDSVSGPLLPLETAQCLMAMDATHIAGNHERQLLACNQQDSSSTDGFARAQLGAAELAWLASHKPGMAFNDELFLCHGTPQQDHVYLLETVQADGARLATSHEIAARLGGIQAHVIACGHSHLPRTVRTPSGQLIVNPGSVGLPAYEDDRPFLHIFETGSPDARYAILEKRHHTWQTQHISVPYAHAAMAQLATQRKRMDWAVALRTGYAKN